VVRIVVALIGVAPIEQLIGEITRGVDLKNMVFRLTNAADVDYEIDGSRPGPVVGSATTGDDIVFARAMNATGGEQDLNQMFASGFRKRIVESVGDLQQGHLVEIVVSVAARAGIDEGFDARHEAPEK